MGSYYAPHYFQPTKNPPPNTSDNKKRTMNTKNSIRAMLDELLATLPKPSAPAIKARTKNINVQ